MTQNSPSVNVFSRISNLLSEKQIADPSNTQSRGYRILQQGELQTSNKKINYMMQIQCNLSKADTLGAIFALSRLDLQIFDQ